MKFKVKQVTAYNPTAAHTAGRKLRLLLCRGLTILMLAMASGVGNANARTWNVKGTYSWYFAKVGVVESYPPSRIDFNAEGIPPNVVRSFEEAITAHAAGCQMASALMVRRTLEEVCLDKGATGNDLKARISDLKGKIVIPDELFAAMDELRLLGNDAAHIEAKSYAKISEEELAVAIEFTKELLKALYQYSGLLSKLRALKKP
jgi:hypothetical protein